MKLQNALIYLILRSMGLRHAIRCTFSTNWKASDNIVQLSAPNQRTKDTKLQKRDLCATESAFGPTKEAEYVLYCDQGYISIRTMSS